LRTLCLLAHRACVQVAEARKLLTDGEVDRALSSSCVIEEALRSAQQDGIVFIDEVDKIVETSRGIGGATSTLRPSFVLRPSVVRRWLLELLQQLWGSGSCTQLREAWPKRGCMCTVGRDASSKSSAVWMQGKAS
jgi:hypothetical protein